MYQVHRPPYSRELLAHLAKMLPRPVGSEEDLAEALAFLKKDGEVPTFARNFVVDAVHGVLDQPQPTKTQPRLADDLKVLVKIDHLTAQLNTEIGRLSPVSQGYLGRGLPRDAFGERNKRTNQISKLRFLLNDLEAATSSAATTLQAELGEDRGGANLSTRRRAFGSRYAYFMTRLIDLFVDVRGLEKLTSTTGSRGGQSCYEFVDAVHQYALGRPVGQVKLFKQLVRKRKAKKNPERPLYPIHEPETTAEISRVRPLTEQVFPASCFPLIFQSTDAFRWMNAISIGVRPAPI